LRNMGLLVTVFVWGLGPSAGCRSKQALHPDVGGELVRKAPAHVAPQTKESMKEMHLLAKDLRRRILGGVAFEAPAKRLAGLVEQLDIRFQPTYFVEGRRRMAERARALVNSEAPKKDFSRLVESCMGCHRRKAKVVLPKLHALQLP